MLGRSGKAAAALLCALGGCSADDANRSQPKPAPPPPAYDLKRPTDGLVEPRPRDASFRRGISLGPLVGAEGEVDESLYGTFLDELAAIGSTDVQMVVYWSQQDATSSEITPHPTQTVDDAVLARLMREAGERSLRVFVMPTLLVDEGGDAARQKLAPADPERWWWSYRRFLLHYARMAQANDVAVFSVGADMHALEGDDKHWRELIADVRKFFKGELTYAARAEHVPSVPFWEALDVAGVSLRSPLTVQSDASDQALRKGFEPLVAELRKWAMQSGHRYLITDVGYPAQAGAAAAPRAAKDDAAPDLAAQLRCYRALYDAWQAGPRLAGVYVWSWPGEGGAKDAGYTPRGKPAQAVVAHWFEGSKGR